MKRDDLKKTAQLEAIAEDRFYKLLSSGDDDMPFPVKRLAMSFFKAGFAHGVRFVGSNPDFFSDDNILEIDK